MLTALLKGQSIDMRILLFETTAYYPSSPLFLEALQQIVSRQPQQHQYSFIDEARFQRTRRSLVARIGRRLLRCPPVDRTALNQALLEGAISFRPDLILICKGAFISPKTLAHIKRTTEAALINYATDDPFNPRVSTPDLVDAIPLYDTYVCTKRGIMVDVAKAGCPSAIYVPFGYKPAVHFPEAPTTSEEHRRFDSDVAFIGGCDDDRVPFFKTLVEAIPTLNLALYGGFWDRKRDLRRYWRGFAVGRDFRLALGGTKIAINLVRRANRDGHTMRSFEIPACGAFMLAERTSEHTALFAEGHAAAYFASPKELVEKVQHYLANEDERTAIAGMARTTVTTGHHTYHDRLCSIFLSASELFYPFSHDLSGGHAPSCA